MATVDKLTKTYVDNLEIPTKDEFHWESRLPGFGLKITPKGKRVFVAKYQVAGGGSRRKTLGSFGPLTVDAARQEATAIIREAQLGNDPQAERDAKKRDLTISSLFDLYVSAVRRGEVIARGGRVKEAEAIDRELYIVETTIKPLLGKILLSDLSRRDIVTFVNRIRSGEGLTGNASGGAGAAKRYKALLSTVLTWAVNQELIEHNPAIGVPTPAQSQKTRRITPQEFATLGAALRSEKGEASSPQVIAAIKLLALSGARRNEIVGLEWSEVDRSGSALRLSKTKTGYSVRVVGEPVFELLDTINRSNSSPFVFPAPRGSKTGYFGGFKKGFERFMDLVDLPKDITPHTFRHTFVSVAADLEYSDSTIASLVGHKGHTMTSRYTHRADAPLIAAANRVTEEIQRQMAG